MTKSRKEKRRILIIIGIILFVAITLHSYSPECQYLSLSSGSYSETDNLNNIVVREFGNNYSIADWNDLKSISNINAWLSCMGFEKGQTFMVTRNGNYNWSGKRQYYVTYSPTGKPYSNFKVHDQIGNELFLGSWYGLNQKILAKKKESKSCSNLTLSSGSYSETSDYELVFVKGGSFKMGNDKGDYNENPIHKVTLSDLYW